MIFHLLYNIHGLEFNLFNELSPDVTHSPGDSVRVDLSFEL